MSSWNVFRLHTSVSVVVVCLFVLIGKSSSGTLSVVNMPKPAIALKMREEKDLFLVAFCLWTYWAT